MCGNIEYVGEGETARGEFRGRELREIGVGERVRGEGEGKG